MAIINRRHFKCIFLNEHVKISIKISMNFVPTGPVNNIPALVQTMAWRRPGGKPLSEPMMVGLLTDIYVTRPQWVNVDVHVDCMSMLCHIVSLLVKPDRQIKGVEALWPCNMINLEG